MKNLQVTEKVQLSVGLKFTFMGVDLSSYYKKTADGYQVQKVDYTGDGAFYGKGIRKFTRNYPGLYKKYFHFDNNKKKKNHLRYLQMYVKNNDLDVKYYMISEDLVKIFK